MKQKARIEKILNIMSDVEGSLKSKSDDLDIVANVKSAATRDAADYEVGCQIDHLIKNMIKLLSEEVK